MHDGEQGRMGRLKKILSGLSDIDSLVVNTSLLCSFLVLGWMRSDMLKSVVF